MSFLPRYSHLNHRYLGLLVGLGAASLSAFGCEHSDAVKKLIPVDGGVGPDGGASQPEKIPDVDRTQGLDPTTALTPMITPVTEDPPEPIVVEDGRTSCGDTPVRDFYTPDDSIITEAQGIMSQMSIDQKVVQLTGIEPPGNTYPYPQGSWEDIQRSRDDNVLGIRGHQWRDGPHGLNIESGVNRDQYNKPDGTGNNATSFPTSVVQGASFDFELVRRINEAMADETVAAGNTVLLGPCMNVLRHPYWGRAQETFGEDTFHLGRIGTASTLGIQEHISACAKHYIGNNIEQDRFLISSDMDEQTLRETYGRHWELVVRDSGVSCMMASYNMINGVKQTQNRHTLTEMLRDDMGFHGFVLTDWWAMPGANRGQGPIDTPIDDVNATEALKAGLDVEVPWTLNFDAIPRAVSNNALGRDVVDQAVLRVLMEKVRFNTAYLNQPIGLATPDTVYDSVSGNVINTEAHAQLASEAAEKGMVLLKNDPVAGGAPVLPIPATTQKVAVIGATVDFWVKSDNPQVKSFNFATDAALGDRGSSRVRPHPSLTVGPFDGIKKHAPTGTEVVLGSTAADVGDADYVVVVVGLTAGNEGEEYTGASDREDLVLADRYNGTPIETDADKADGNLQNDLVTAVANLGKPMVVIIEAGGVVDMPWLSRVPGVVMAWYPGQQGGDAMGRLLFGKANFSGRLPVTWPTSIDQFPNFNDGSATFMDYNVGYRWFDANNLTPLYAFGHGLSYSTYEYKRLHIPCGEITSNGLIQVQVDVKNAAGPAGEEVVMVFASWPESKYRRSKKELRGFARVPLGPGEIKRVSIPVRVHDLKVWVGDADGYWAVEEGPVELSVGPSSDQLKLMQTINITGDAPASAE